MRLLLEQSPDCSAWEALHYIETRPASEGPALGPGSKIGGSAEHVLARNGKPGAGKIATESYRHKVGAKKKRPIKSEGTEAGDWQEKITESVPRSRVWWLGRKRSAALDDGATGGISAIILRAHNIA